MRLVLSTLLVAIFLSFNQLFSFSQVTSETEKVTDNPKPASASVYNLGLKSYEEGDIDSAIKYFKSAVDIDPNFVDAYFNLGAIYKKRKDYYKAITAFQKAVDIDSGDHEAAYELATCYFEIKNYPNAKKYFSIIPESFPKYAEARQKIEETNRYLAIETAQETKDEQVIKSPEVQAQLLVDKLTEEQDSKETKKVEGDLVPQVVKELPSNVQAQLLVKKLSEPTKETIMPKVRTITGDFSGPAGITKDSNNNIYIANFLKNNVERITPDGKREVYLEGVVQGPIGLVTDEEDNLFIANYNSDSIIKVTPDKTISVVLDNISKPYYLFYDKSTRKLYVTSQGNNSLVEINTLNISNNPITSNE